MPAPASRFPAWLIAAAIVPCLLVAVGLFARRQAHAALVTRTAEQAFVVVATLRGSQGTANDALVLPATVAAATETRLYARSTGYVRRLAVDIGSSVTAGQLLAELDTPELDQQLAQARAELETSRANHAIAKSTAERWQQLVERQLVARQTADERVAEADARRTALDAAAANEQRLVKLAAFKRIVAPFDGVITARNVELGQLVDAGNSGVELFRLAGNDGLRITAFVPQALSAQIRPGVTAKLSLPERPGVVVPAEVRRTARAIDPGSRTLRVELDVTARTELILPGAYAELRFDLAADTTALRLPVSTLIFRGGGAMVAVVGSDDRVALRPIRIGRDFGTEFEVLEGLAADDDIVDNPPDSLQDGQAVRRAEKAAR
jgi:RND family efflux transporter MFP subunit